MKISKYLDGSYDVNRKITTCVIGSDAFEAIATDYAGGADGGGVAGDLGDGAVAD